MVATTRERALEAAVQLIGHEGVRALTHARVDERAMLPLGSTSNWFRTRRALLAGVVDWIAEQERADVDPAQLLAIDSVEGLVDGLCGLAERLSGPWAARTKARYALFLELSADPDLAEPLLRQRHEFEEWTVRLVAAAGIPDPTTAARALMALADGLMLHRVTVDPDLDLRPVISRVIRSLAVSAR